VALRAIAGGEQPLVLHDTVRIGDGPVEHFGLEKPVGVTDERTLAAFGVARAIFRKGDGA
jgi:hypothetical protein